MQVAKPVKNYVFKNSKTKLNWDDAWLDGQVWELTEKDFGPVTESGAKGKINTLRKAVAAFEGSYTCRVEADETNTKLYVQVFTKTA